MGSRHIRSFSVLLVVLLASPSWHTSKSFAQDDVPTMTNSSLDSAFEPLPPGWPAEIKDIHLRGSVCQDGYGKEGARKHETPGDVLLPVAGYVPQGLDSQYLAVRPLPFLIRRDVRQAVFEPDPDVAGRYELHLQLTDEGMEKVSAYTTNNIGQCVALVADGKVLWWAQLDGAVTENVFVLSGAFSSSQSLALAEAFNRQ